MVSFHHSYLLHFHFLSFLYRFHHSFKKNKQQLVLLLVFIYLFGCVGSQVQDIGSSLVLHCGAWTL